MKHKGQDIESSVETLSSQVDKRRLDFSRMALRTFGTGSSILFLLMVIIKVLEGGSEIYMSV